MDAMQPQIVYMQQQGLSAEPETPSSPSTKAKEVAPFLKNLRKILDCENQDILRWTPDGKAFEIHDMQQMMDFVLPKYFKHAKYTSFQRQLNYFNFRKWTKSKAVVCTFSNPHFVRDQPCLSWRINRKKSSHPQLKNVNRSSSPHQSQAKKSSKRKSKSQSHSEPASELPSPDMTITLPMDVKDARAVCSFPSPTEVYGSAGDLAFGLNGDRLSFNSAADVCFHEPIVLDAQSFDWVDTLYSSLDGGDSKMSMSPSLPLFLDPSALTFDMHL
jgi:hypothetical protein